MTVQKSRIFLADDHPLVREWLTSLIHQQPDLEVCGEADNGPDALQKMAELRPDLAIVDISLKESSGLDLIKALKARHPEIAVIVLSMHEESLYAERAIRAGARGYVVKRETANKIITAIRQVVEGQLAVSADVATSLARKLAAGRNATASPVEQLSDRELEIFRLLGQGFDTRTVANRLHISIKTVQTYCARIKEKLDLANANELLREAVRWSENGG